MGVSEDIPQAAIRACALRYPTAAPFLKSEHHKSKQTKIGIIWLISVQFKHIHEFYVRNPMGP